MEKTILNSNPLGTEKIGRLMMKFAIPSIISLVVNSLYNMVDQIFIGQGVGYLGNAATNVILPLTTVMMAIAVMIGDGAAAFMSLNIGKGNEKKAAQGVGNAITLTISGGVIITILFEIFLEPLCNLFGATENSLPYAMEYGRIIILGFVFFSIANSFASIIRADGRPNASMTGLLIGCITNIILDPLFIFVFKWGVKGAALATIIGQFLNAVYYMFCLFRFKSIKLKKEYFVLELQISGKVASLGTSSLILQAALVLVMATMNNVLKKYGAVSKYGADIPLAALGVTMKVSQLLTNVAVGLAAGIQPIYGYNYGSGKYDRVKKLYKWALFDTTIILLAALFVFQVFPEPIINLFGQESDLYMEYAVKCFRIYLLGTFMIGANAVTGVFFQSIGRPVQSAFLSLSRQIVFLVPGLIILGALAGVEGLLWAGPISDIVAGIISLITIRVCWNKIFANSKVNVPSEEVALKPSKPGVIITIAREHGSGGKQIGKVVAEKLGIPFYYKEMTALAAQESGLHKEFISDINSNVPNMMKELYLSTTVVQQAVVAQMNVIRKIADNGSCVIVGRAADYVLRDYENVVSIFVYAPEDYKVQRVMEIYGDSPEEAKRNVRRSAEARAAYYKNISGNEWQDMHNYDFAIDGSVGVEKAADMIIDLIKSYK